MRLVSLNTWMGVVREPLLDFFSAHKDVDIFCLQEIYKDAVGKREEHPTLKIELELFERIQERLEDTHSGVFKPAVEDYYGLAIFHKNNLKILEEGEVSIYDNPTWEASISQRGKHSRNLQYIRLLHAGSPLLIANVHGLWTGEGKGDTPERLEQSRRIQDFLMRKYELKVLMGDLNLRLDTKSIGVLTEGMRNLIEEYKITSTRTSFYDETEKFADYAFVSPEAKVLDFKVLPEEVSDHAALYLEIS